MEVVETLDLVGEMAEEIDVRDEEGIVRFI